MLSDFQKAISYVNRKMVSLTSSIYTKSEVDAKVDSQDLSGLVASDDIDSIVKLTQAEYDALTPVETTLYIIVG